MADRTVPSLTDSNDHEQDVLIGVHVVTLIDFLGQKSKLSKWNSMPKTETEKKQFLAALHESVGTIVRARENFKKKFHCWQEARELTQNMTDTFPDGGQALREYLETSIAFDHFSDTIVVYSPIVNRHDQANANTILAHVVTAGALLLEAVSQGDVFRGAIEIGMAAQHPKIGIYGPVLSAVHDLESCIAKYPRIIVGRGLCEYLSRHFENGEDSKQASLNREIAGRCLQLLGEDRDGNKVIDYMGDAFGELAPKKLAWRKLRADAHAFARRELERFTKNGDSKLKKRYEQLVEYNRSRGWKP